MSDSNDECNIWKDDRKHFHEIGSDWVKEEMVGGIVSMGFVLSTKNKKHDTPGLSANNKKHLHPHKPKSAFLRVLNFGTTLYVSVE